MNTNKIKAFTLVELLAVIVILSIVLAIAVPTIAGIIRSATRGSFESDAKMVLKAVEYKKLADDNFDVTAINKETIAQTLGLSPKITIVSTLPRKRKFQLLVLLVRVSGMV
jgi:prepilin-type N-terminal cleavage/methylation domain-containing protein